MTKRGGASRGALYYHLETLFGQGTSIGSTEGELLDRFVSGRDGAAFEVLVARHGPMVLGVCRQLLRDPNDVDDAFQATFLVLVRKAGTLRQCDLLGNWLYGVAYRVAARARSQSSRRLARFTSEHDSDRSLNIAECCQPVGTDQATLVDQGPLLHKELSVLPDKYRVPIVLCYFEGLTHDEAASRLGWPLGTVKGRLARARDLLRRRLISRGVTLSAAGLASQLASCEAKAAVPASLQLITLKCAQALAFDVGSSLVATSAVSLPVYALVEGVLHTMIANQVKSVVLPLLLIAGTVATGVGVAAARMSGGPADGEKAEQVRAASVSTGSTSSSNSASPVQNPSAASAVFSQLLSRYRDPQIEDIERLQKWSYSTFEADQAIATTGDEQIAAYDAHLARMKKLFELTQRIPVSDKKQRAKVKLAQHFVTQAEKILKNFTQGSGAMGSMTIAGAAPIPKDDKPSSKQAAAKDTPEKGPKRGAANGDSPAQTPARTTEEPLSSGTRKPGRPGSMWGGSSGMLRSSIASSAAELASRETNPKSKGILKKLEAPISMPFNGSNSLEEILKYIKQMTASLDYAGIPIYVDPRGLKEAEASLQSTVELDLEGVPLKTTFRLMLKQIGLAYCVRDGVLIVSSAQGIAEELQEAASELQANDPNAGAAGGFGGGGGFGGNSGGGMR